jgi:Fe-S-cluster-containing hydrogenase component 2
VAVLEEKAIRAVYPPVGFPMEAGRWMTDRLWVVSHKPVAIAAGMGKMGIHRNVIHPKFGNFILLETVLLDCEVSQYGRQIDFNPCLSCKLCVAACPVGAIGADGHFNFSTCLTHNYAEFLGGFSNWVETVADSRNGLDYRRRIKEDETISMWQSLAFGPNYKAAYCMAVCPAGENVIGAYLKSKNEFVQETLRPLQERVEPLYIVPGSDADAHARKRFPHKTIRHVGGPVRPANLKTFIEGMPLGFQREAAGDLRATYHFTFTGKEEGQFTVIISGKELSVESGLRGSADLRITADSDSWLRFLRRETGIVKELLLRRVRVRGPLKLLQAFGRCFPT